MNKAYKKFSIASHLRLCSVLIILSANSIISQIEKSGFSDFDATGYFLQIGGGLSFPMLESQFKSTANLGYNVHAGLGTIFKNYLAGGIHIQYNSFTNNKEVTTGTATLSISSFMANIYLGLFKKTYKIHPYSYFGLGLVLLTISGQTDNFVLEYTDGVFGMRAGGGAYYLVSSKISIYAETGLDYNFNSGTAKGYIPIKLGVIVFQY